MTQKLEIEDFSGGVTDYYLNAPANKLKRCDNLLLIQYPDSGKPYTRPGSTFRVNAANAQLPTGAQRISTMRFLDQVELFQSSSKLYSLPASTFTEITSPTGNAFRNASTISVFSVTDAWQHQQIWAHSGYMAPLRVRRTGTGTFAAESAGLPKGVGSLGTTTAGANNWLYKIVVKYTYTTADGLTFIDRGTPSDSIVANNVATADVNTTAITNSSLQSYNLVSSEVEIYRTINNGTVFYLRASFSDASVSHSLVADALADATLQTNELLYTTGGVVANDAPPQCSLVHLFGDICYYANVKIGSATYKYRLMHSVVGDIDAVPETFFLDLDDEIVGLSATKSNVVVMCKDGAVYRIDGVYDELGRGGMSYERIADAATCVSSQGVVQALDGLFWAGRDGIYYTDGYRVIRLNADYDKTWATWVTTSTQQARIQGKYDRRKNRIWWTIQSADSITDVDKCYVLDLNYGIRENATFTTVSGLESFSPTAIDFNLAGELIRCDRRGYVMKHSDTLYNDLKIDTAVSPSLWVKQTIFFDLESVAFNFGTSFLRKYVTGINVVADSVTNLSLNISSDNDDGKSVADLLPIRYRGSLVWGDPDIYWGDPSIVWNLDGLILEKRRMPARNLRCSYKSVRFSNAYVNIFGSDVLGTADIDATGKTVTLTDTVTYDWPDNSVDWYISFQNDGYTKDYLITARTDDVLTYSDADNTSMSETGGQWILRGYPKGEIFNLLNYCLHFEIFGQTQDVFNNADTGAND